MKKLLQISVIYLIFGVLLVGCQYGKTTPNQTIYETEVKSTSSLFSADFNKESYIWEDFLFPTNRTSGVQ